jgi:vancomycin permeability regulator SanA
VKLSVVGAVSVLSLIGLAGAVIVDRADGLLLADLDAVPHRSVVIVPGAKVESNGQPGLHVGHRLEAAAALFDRGTVDHVLVSGDNRESHYNEPVVMRNWLVDSAGLDPADITLDYAGFDTWDTCLRAREQFGVTDAVVVTQERYADRAAALCDATGIDIVVLIVDTPHEPLLTSTRLRFRERLAAVKAGWDLVRNPPAHHGGPFIGLVGSEGMPEGGHSPDWSFSQS